MYCDACNSWEHKKKTEPEKYDNFMNTHECSINHVGSAGSIEASGLKGFFMTSVETNKLRYTNYIGDGESKSYNDIFQADPYEGTGVNKLECIGHIQKHVGTRLRKLKSANTKTVLSDGKKLSGERRLTENFINKLQNYYEIAIRSSCHGNVYYLKKAFVAVLYYCSEASSLETQHQFCPTGVDSWCKYHADKETYKPKPRLRAAIREFIRLLFLKLSDENLLSKCLYDKTQNSNESINGVIWKRCPKDVFVGRKVLEKGVASAVISSNDGTKRRN